MTRQIHDQFAKEYLEELLTPLGTIRKSKKVKSCFFHAGETSSQENGNTPGLFEIFVHRDLVIFFLGRVCW